MTALYLALKLRSVAKQCVSNHARPSVETRASARPLEEAG